MNTSKNKTKGEASQKLPKVKDLTANWSTRTAVSKLNEIKPGQEASQKLPDYSEHDCKGCGQHFSTCICKEPPQHSPLPWETWTSETSDFIDIGTREGYGEVARLAKSDVGYKDARLIVASVNNAGKLAEALEHLEAELQFAFDDVPAGVDAWMATARKALADWKERELALSKE